MTILDSSLQVMRDLDIPSGQYCLTGSAALAALSGIARERNLPPLILRQPSDIDILTLRPTFEKVSRLLPGYHGIGTDACLNIDIGHSCLELTRQWPYMLNDTSTDLTNISVDIGGIRAMLPGPIAALKNRLQRDKDMGDLRQLDIALGLRPASKLTLSRDFTLARADEQFQSHLQHLSAGAVQPAVIPA